MNVVAFKIDRITLIKVNLNISTAKLVLDVKNIKVRIVVSYIIIFGPIMISYRRHFNNKICGGAIENCRDLFVLPNFFGVQHFILHLVLQDVLTQPGNHLKFIA
jgi:hypothetical protein